jgi:hypothetical protein
VPGTFYWSCDVGDVNVSAQWQSAAGVERGTTPPSLSEISWRHLIWPYNLLGSTFVCSCCPFEDDDGILHPSVTFKHCYQVPARQHQGANRVDTSSMITSRIAFRSIELTLGLKGVPATRGCDLFGF